MRNGASRRWLVAAGGNYNRVGFLEEIRGGQKSIQGGHPAGGGFNSPAPPVSLGVSPGRPLLPSQKKKGVGVRERV